ncbi:MAG: HTH domain-containing protein [Salinivirgaceae bacterium]|nr:HTH domain-containing protein [Salinivirgaceae bacterium]
MTIPQLALKTSLSRRTIIRELTELQSKGSLSRVLGRKNGRWNLADIGDTKDGTKDGTKDVVKNVTKQLSERQRIILDLIVENPAITTEEMSQKTGVTSRTIMRDISSLMDMGLLKRQGGRKDGRWILIE